MTTPSRRLGELTIDELLASAVREIRYATELAEADDSRRYVILSSGKRIDMLSTALGSAEIRIDLAMAKSEKGEE